MAAILEKVDSPNITYAGTEASSATRTYQITGVIDELVALSMAGAYSPAVYVNLVRHSVNVSNVTNGIWDVTVQYKTLIRAPVEIGEFRYSARTTGGTRKITRALVQSSYRVEGSGDTIPNFRNMIGVSDQGVEGADIISPAFEWQEERTFAMNSVTAAYEENLAGMTGSVNALPFRGKAIGRVLFLGADMSRRTSEHWHMVFNFRLGVNLAGVAIGQFAGVFKNAHDYAWTYDVPVTSGTTVIRNPRYFNVAQVYPFYDFALLGIGVTPLLP